MEGLRTNQDDRDDAQLQQQKSSSAAAGPEVDQQQPLQQPCSVKVAEDEQQVSLQWHALLSVVALFCFCPVGFVAFYLTRKTINFVNSLKCQAV